MGAAVQLALLDELLALPDDVALVLVHAINPYGFAHVRRVDGQNIDLNRNFLRPGETWTGAPDGYAELDALLNPERPRGSGAGRRSWRGRRAGSRGRASAR